MQSLHRSLRLGALAIAANHGYSGLQVCSTVMDSDQEYMIFILAWN